jgi:ATP-binding cassette subfamily B protein
MGFFAGLNPEKYDRQYSDRVLARRIAAYFKAQARRLSIISVLVVIMSIITAALPVLVGRVVDMLGVQPSVQAIWLIGFALLAVGVGNWGFNWARRSFTVRAVGDVILQLRCGRP